MRKKEEHLVSRKMAAKRNTFGITNNYQASVLTGNGTGEQQSTATGPFGGRPGTSSHNPGSIIGLGVVGGSTMSMNIRNRVKQQNQQQRLRSNGKYSNNKR
jgi:hypothetical protein